MATWDEVRHVVREHLDDAQIHIRQAALCGERWVEALGEDDDHGLSSVLVEIVSALAQDHLALESLDTLVGATYVVLTGTESDEEE